MRPSSATSSVMLKNRGGAEMVSVHLYVPQDVIKWNPFHPSSHGDRSTECLKIKMMRVVVAYGTERYWNSFPSMDSEAVRWPI